MTIEQLPSGAYRIRQSYKGKRYSITVPYKPTKKEAMILITEKMNEDSGDKPGKPRTFYNCSLEYIENRGNMISPGTVRGYLSITKAISEEFNNMNIYDIANEDIVIELNAYSKNHSPKSVRNMHGFISAVMKSKRPKFVIEMNLPQQEVKRFHRPSENDVKALLNASVGTKYHIAFQLGVLGLRRGEICALTLDDLNGNELSITKDMVEGKGSKWIIKNTPKNKTSNRIIQIPPKLADEIRESGFIFDLTPPMIVNTLHKYQDNLNMQRFRFHDLRSYCASYLHLLGYPDKYIEQYCGWSSNYTMNKIYKEAMEDKTKELQKAMADALL